jgi:hypothetical protein
MTLPLGSITPEGRAGLDALLADPQYALLGTDFDGTLAPIVADPRKARAHPGAIPAMNALAGTIGTLAIITGRPADLVARRGFDTVPGIIVPGHYGWQRWQEGSSPRSAHRLPSRLRARYCQRCSVMPPPRTVHGSKTRATRWLCTSGGWLIQERQCVPYVTPSVISPRD